MDDLDFFGTDDDKPSTVFSAVAPERKQTHQAGRVEAIHSVGGQRGVFATQDLSAGQLVVLEWPTLTWEDLDLSSPADLLSLILRIVRDAQALEVTRALHPRSLADADEEERALAMEIFTEEQALPELLALVPREEVARVYLALKHNGFGSGLYRDLCMVNHSCEPNCIKFEPRTGSRGASEVWTTRPVRAGEELTISYCSPLESLSAPMRSYLSDQHGFDCLCSRCEKLSSFVYPADGALEEDIGDWEGWVEDSELELQFVKYEATDVPILDRMAARAEEVFSRLEERQKEIFEPDLLRLQARDRMLLCSILLKKVALLESSLSTSKRKDTKAMSDIAKSLLSCNAQLLALKRKYLGDDHPDLLTTLIDLSNALDLSRELLPLEEVNGFLAAIPWDGVFSGVDDVSSLKQMKSLRDVLKKETSRLKDLYSLAKRCLEAVKITKKPGLAYWGPVSP